MDTVAIGQIAHPDLAHAETAPTPRAALIALARQIPRRVVVERANDDLVARWPPALGGLWTVRDGELVELVAGAGSAEIRVQGVRIDLDTGAVSANPSRPAESMGVALVRALRGLLYAAALQVGALEADTVCDIAGRARGPGVAADVTGKLRRALRIHLGTQGARSLVPLAGRPARYRARLEAISPEAPTLQVPLLEREVFKMYPPEEMLAPGFTMVLEAGHPDHAQGTLVALKTQLDKIERGGEDAAPVLVQIAPSMEWSQVQAIIDAALGGPQAGRPVLLLISGVENLVEQVELLQQLRSRMDIAWLAVTEPNFARIARYEAKKHGFSILLGAAHMETLGPLLPEHAGSLRGRQLSGGLARLVRPAENHSLAEALSASALSFERLWGNLSTSERAAMVAGLISELSAALTPSIRQNRRFLRMAESALLRRGYLEDAPGGGVRVASLLIAEHLRQHLLDWLNDEEEDPNELWADEVSALASLLPGEKQHRIERAQRALMDWLGQHLREAPSLETLLQRRLG